MQPFVLPLESRCRLSASSIRTACSLKKTASSPDFGQHLWVCCSCLVLTGILTLVASVVGYIGARFRPAYLLYYLIVAGVATGLQLVILLCIFFAEDKVAKAIQMESSTSESTRLAEPQDSEASTYFTLLLQIVPLSTVKRRVLRASALLQASVACCAAGPIL